MAPTEGSVAIHATRADAGADSDSEDADDDNSDLLHQNTGSVEDAPSHSASRNSNDVHRSLLVGVCPQ